MNSSIPNRLERALAVAALDTSQRLAMLRTLVEEPLWFPIAPAPGLPRQVQPNPGEHVPFWIAKDDEGPFIPMFTSRSALVSELRRMREPYAIATMKGADACAAVARQGHAMRLNPGSKFSGSFPLQIMRTIASGEVFTEKPMDLKATVRMLTAALLPPALVKAVLEECALQPDILGVWIGDLGGKEGVADLHHLHVALWLRDAARTPVDELHRAMRLALPGRTVEMIRFDAAGSPEALTEMMQFAPIFARPD